METKEFAAVLSMMQHATGMNEPYDSILFDEDTIKTYNGSTGIVMVYHTGIEGSIKADPLIKTVRGLGGKEITVSSKTTNKDKSSATLKSDKKEKIKLSLNPASDKFFPFDYTEEEFVDLPENFQDALSLCSLTTGGPVLKDFVQGVYFLEDEVVATNDAAVARVKLDGDVGKPFFVHNQSVGVLLRTVPIAVRFYKKKIVFECLDNMQVICPVYQDYTDFPYPYKKLMSSFEDEYQLPKGFNQAIRKANSALYGAKKRQSRFKFGKGKLIVRSQNKTEGITLTDELPLKTKLTDDFYIDPELLTKLDFCDKFSINETSMKISNDELGVEVVIAKILK